MFFNYFVLSSIYWFLIHSFTEGSRCGLFPSNLPGVSKMVIAMIGLIVSLLDHFLQPMEFLKVLVCHCCYLEQLFTSGERLDQEASAKGILDVLFDIPNGWAIVYYRVLIFAKHYILF